jgi:hypothetical protein
VKFIQAQQAPVARHARGHDLQGIGAALYGRMKDRGALHI